VQALEQHDPVAARVALAVDLTEAKEQVMKELARQQAIRMIGIVMSLAQRAAAKNSIRERQGLL